MIGCLLQCFLLFVACQNNVNNDDLSDFNDWFASVDALGGRLRVASGQFGLGVVPTVSGRKNDLIMSLPVKHTLSRPSLLKLGGKWGAFLRDVSERDARHDTELLASALILIRNSKKSQW